MAESGVDSAAASGSRWLVPLAILGAVILAWVLFRSLSGAGTAAVTAPVTTAPTAATGAASSAASAAGNATSAAPESNPLVSGSGGFLVRRVADQHLHAQPRSAC
jgi:hypothetical protein